ncbi:hypothetical protein [Enterobacter cancerogenus]|uniref:hypothetical protein n=1 Tax=Enterobacter cancerogenus TaxID=69218 RepID=UPI0028B97E5C|nr:hypothetical protein [Enterobacter cancerogenus]MDT7009227.1 hypothetical protein [Enterobacter cancerogenus]WNN57764.1 hypothetical protein RIN64_04770 [Enterobacter cancerogenus]
MLHKLMNMNGFLFWGYLISILMSSLILFWVYFQPLNYIIWLFIPLIVPILFSICIIITRNKEQRDLIKSLNDSTLFSISAITTALVIIKTIDLTPLDAFDLLMKNRVGYILICGHTILYTIKATIAMCETYENWIKISKAKYFIFLA